MNQESSKKLNISEEMAEALERVEQGGGLADEGIGIDFYHAWKSSQETGNKLINFYELIHNELYMLENLRRAGISEFTISCKPSTTLAFIVNRLEDLGCPIEGFTRVEPEHGIGNGNDELIPALLFRIK